MVCVNCSFSLLFLIIWFCLRLIMNILLGCRCYFLMICDLGMGSMFDLEVSMISLLWVWR